MIDACARVSTDGQSATAQTKLLRQVGAEKVFRHDYEDVVHRLVWGTVHEFLLALRAMAETELAAHG